MASSPVTAPSPVSSSNSSTTPAPPSSDSSPPTPVSSPPPESPPPSDSSPPPPPPPPSDSSPPPPSNKTSPTPPTNKNSSTPQSPPPPPHSSSSSGTLSPPPPPRASSQKSPSPPSAKSSPESESGLNDTGRAIIGVVAAALFIFMLIACVVCARRKKKRKHESMQYYGGPKGDGGGDQYYNSSQHPNWHSNAQMGDHVVKLPQSSGTMPSSHGGWHAPPPPPHMMISGEASSNFSGPRHPPLPPPSPSSALGGFNTSTFSYDDLAAATGGFSQANLLGQGGFGYVHKGVLPNGKEVAVKSLKSGSGQGEREFQAEVEIISRVHHRHLVSLVGYCIAGGQRMLVYDFLPNNTLEHHLYGKGLPVMEWSTRLRIALGSAKGLAYLHEDCHPRIIHRDIKAANILLDFNYEAMVADFGLAKLSEDNHTHVSTRVMGTFGYLAPEYASSGKLTEKSDVFSYGIMLLELITGKRPVDAHSTMEDSLVDWARPLLAQGLEDGDYDELVDPRLEKNYNSSEMARMAACAAACIRHSARKRPKMSQVVRALEGDVSLDDLNGGAKPGQSSIYGSSSDYDAGSYNSDMKKFRKMALSSQEFSSEYAVTSSSGDSREIGTQAGNKALQQ